MMVVVRVLVRGCNDMFYHNIGLWLLVSNDEEREALFVSLAFGNFPPIRNIII